MIKLIYPLKIGRCDNSGHIQLINFIEPSEMFRNYLYISSVSSTLEKHLKSISDFICDFIDVNENDLCIDIDQMMALFSQVFLKREKEC